MTTEKENKVRLILKETVQPPFETSATVRWSTIEVESEALADTLRVSLDPNTCNTYEVVGAELVK